MTSGRVFDAAWFRRHQRSLRVALNTPGFGRELRAALGVQPHGRLVRLFPHASIVRHGQIYIADFRTHAKYAKRLHAELLPLWKLFHWFDLRIANRFVPAFNLGFDTLTAYPDPHPETTTVDGMVTRAGSSETWATITSSTGTQIDDSSASFRVFGFRGSTTTNQWDQFARSIFLFDTSSIPSSAIIVDAVLSLWGNNKADPTSNTPNADIYTSTPASNTALANGDLLQLGSTSQTGSPVAYSSFTLGAYNAFTFNATGRGNVIKGGISKFGGRNANYDVAAVAPTWVSLADSFLDAVSADSGGTANDPQLVVTFSIPLPDGEAYFPGPRAARSPSTSRSFSVSPNLNLQGKDALPPGKQWDSRFDGS